MSLFKYLQMQEVEPEDANSPLDYFRHEQITLEDTIDGERLDQMWSSIISGSDSDE